MKRVYSAFNLPEAQLMADMLQHAGIRVRVFNQNASGALGELPVDSAQPQVWVEDDHRLEEARRLIESFQVANIREAPWTCRECSESNPATFETCWNCGLASS
jgi:hypothetical protein